MPQVQMLIFGAVVFRLQGEMIPRFLKQLIEMMQRTRWSAQDIEKLREIYDEQILLGRKKLWVRITERVNKTVRKAKRQAIEYKWKNFCKTGPSTLKLCQNQRLIELLFDLIPDWGYKQLARHEEFFGVTQSNLKNIFYSNIRSMSNFLHTHVGVKEAANEITKMLKDRRFLLTLKYEGIDLVQFRKKINILRKCLVGRGRQRKNKTQAQLSQQEDDKIIISNQYSQIRNLYLQRQNDMEKLSKTTIQSLSTHYTKKQDIRRRDTFIPYMTSMQSLEQAETAQKQELKLQAKQENPQSLGETENVYMKRQSQWALSYEWLCSDF